MQNVKPYGWVAILAGCVLGMGEANRLLADDTLLPQPLRDALARYVELKTFSVTWTAKYQLGPAALAKGSSAQPAAAAVSKNKGPRKRMALSAHVLSRVAGREDVHAEDCRGQRMEEQPRYPP